MEDPLPVSTPTPVMVEVAREVADDEMAKARASAIAHAALTTTASYAATSAVASAMDGSLIDSSNLTATSILLEILSMAKAGFKVAPLVAEKAFHAAEYATALGLDIGREAIAKTAAVATASVSYGSMGIVAAAEGIGAVLDKDVSAVTEKVHRSSISLQQGITGSAQVLSTGLSISDFFASSGISIGKHITTNSVRAGQSMMETLDDGVTSILTHTMGIDVKSLRQQSPSETIAELVDLAKSFNDKLANIDSMEIAQAITVFARLVRAVEDMDTPRSAQVAALRAEQRGASPYTPPPLDRLTSLTPAVTRRLSQPELSAARIGTLSPVLARYILFSCCAYGPNFMRWLGMVETQMTNTEDFVVEMTGLKKSDVLVTEVTSSLSRPGYYLAVDHITHSIVLAIRGSARLLDVLTDLRCGYTPFKHGTAHRGMLESATWFSDHLGPLVRDTLVKHPGYRVVVTGHSLGAGVASLLTHLWIDDPRINLPDHPIHCYAFGAPCVISPELSSLGEDYISSFVLGHDIVCRLSLGSVQDLCTVILRLTRNKTSKQREGKGLRLRTSAQYLTRMLETRSEEGTEAREKEDASLRSILHHLRSCMNADKLFPAGHVYHLLRYTSDEQQQQHEATIHAWKEAAAKITQMTLANITTPTTTPTLATSASWSSLPPLPPSAMSTMATSSTSATTSTTSTKSATSSTSATTSTTSTKSATSATSTLTRTMSAPLTTSTPPRTSATSSPTCTSPLSPSTSPLFSHHPMSPDTFTKIMIDRIGDISPPLSSRTLPPVTPRSVAEADHDMSKLMSGDYKNLDEEKTVLHNIAQLTHQPDIPIQSTPAATIISMQQHSFSLLASLKKSIGMNPETRGFYLIQGHWTDLTEIVFSSRTLYDHMPELYHQAVMLAAPPEVAVKEARKETIPSASVPLAATHVKTVSNM